MRESVAVIGFVALAAMPLVTAPPQDLEVAAEDGEGHVPLKILILPPGRAYILEAHALV